MTNPDVERIRALRQEIGTSRFQRALKIFKRERLENRGRDKRKQFPSSVYWDLFAKQRGICRWCRQPLGGEATDHEIDHINPNRKDFNAKSNLQLLHGEPCNREKSSKSIHQLSKETGRTYEQIVGDEI